MTSRAKPFLGFMISRRPHARHFLFGMIGALALHSLACSGTVETSTTATGAGAANGSGGMGGSGSSGGNGGMGTAGGPVDGGSGAEYVAYNLFTHVPRFVIFKIDHTRNLCFRIFVEGFTGPGPLTINVNDNWAVSHSEVTNNVSDCTMSMGFPPQPMTFASATSGMGTIVVPGGFPCAVDVHATISYDPVAPWVPANESFDIDMLNVDGGCG